MIKKLLFSLLFVLCFLRGQTQDMIVTQANDSIKGTITNVNDQFITIITPKGQNLILNRNMVADYQYAYYVLETETGRAKEEKRKYSRFRLAVNGGYSYRTARIGEVEPVLEKYYKSLKNGFSFGADFNYFFNRSFGIGLNYSGNYYNSILLYFEEESTGAIFSGKDKIALQQIIPVVGVRAVGKRNPNNYFLFTAGIGYVGYKDKIYFEDIHIETQKGSSLTMLLRLGYDISISKNFAIILQSSLTGGVLSRMRMVNELTGERVTVDLDKEYRVGIGKIDLSMGFRFGI